MKELDFVFYFGFYGGVTAEDEATDITVSNSLYNKLKKIYQESSEVNLQSILDEEKLTDKQRAELSDLVEELKSDLIANQHENGDDYDPDTGEEYDFSEVIIDIEVVPPEEWDEE